jgi:hypothetical protein
MEAFYGSGSSVLEAVLLRREAEYLHRALFGYASSTATSDYYVRAHSALSALSQASETERALVQCVVDRGLDAMGIESWLRGGGKRHLLSAKLLLLAYIGECDAGHAEFSRSLSPNYSPWIALANASFSAGYRLLRGRMQLLRHGLF